MDIFNILLGIHIVGGGTSLLLGLYILIAKKGTKRHKKVGIVYYTAMVAAALVAMPMCYLHPNYFLFIISVFTSYMLVTGKRYLMHKTLSSITVYDWSLTIIMALFGSAFIVFGFINLLKGETFGIVFLVFGLISLLFVRQDWVNFKGKSTIRNFFLTTHIQRMMGSYIASVTAFLVVNNEILPPVIVWLLPTVVIAPLITIWTRKYKVDKAVA
jgi:uncharacterized membrane protein